MKKVTKRSLDWVDSQVRAIESSSKNPASQRHEAVAPNRQTPVVQEKFVLSENSQFVTIDEKPFRDRNGGWNEEAVYKAQQAYPDKEVRFKDKKTGHLSLDRSKYFKPDGTYTQEGWNKYTNLSGEGRSVSFYDKPATDPNARKFAPPPKPKGLADATPTVKIAPKPVVPKTKVSSADAALRAISEEQGALRSLRQLRYHVAKAEIEKAPTKPAKAVVPKPVKTAPPPKAVIERMPRIGSRGRRNLAAQSRNSAREGLERQLAEIKARRHAIVEARDRTRRNAKARTPEKRAIKAANRMSKPAAEFAARLRSQPGFGQTPVKMLMAKAGMSGRAPGKKAVMAAMTHAEKYPAMNRSAGAPFSSSASGRQTLSVPRGLAERPLYPGSRRGAIFATSNTLATKRFPQGGSGIFFRINTTEVIANLTQRYPTAIRQAAINAADRIGRKMLDIVEPYVPKDTGLLYSSGATNVEMTAGGGVDMENGEAYPSGQMFGVSISYNAPYAEIVYFNEDNAHGARYNAEHGTSEKDERETARWIEVAFQKERGAFSGLLNDYAVSITAAINAVGARRVSFTTSTGRSVDFLSYLR